MKHGTITIHFQHYWHCGSGQAGEGDVDLLPVSEECGLPYVPGRALRGRLKWAARELGWGDGKIEAFFGKEDARNLESTGRLHVASGTMRDAFAIEARRQFTAQRSQCPEVSALFEDIASTALKNGTADHGTLRRVRYAVPVSVFAEVSLEENGEVTWSELKKLVGQLRFIGKGKHDGFGWCSAALSEPVDDAGRQTDCESTAAYDLEIELLDDVVLSATSATTGGHRTLDYVPGSALMGAFAGVFFKSLRAQKLPNAEELGASALLEGKVSFGNAVPITGKHTATVPMPLSWHYAKVKDGVDRETKKVVAENVANFAVKECDQGKLRAAQPVQMREGWLDAAAGWVVSVDRTQTLKTAIDPDVAKYETALESALFGYEAIRKGARFIARLEVKNADAELCKAVREAFDGRIIRLGRSKGTEFGRARCTLKKAQDTTATATGAGTITLLVESDLALLDANGFPTLLPEPRHFGLKSADGWTLCRQRSFLRFRRYSLWNAKRGGPDVERQVISKGSVIVFASTNGSTATLTLRAGLGQAEGLGRVRRAENWMAAETPVFDNPNAPAPAAEFKAEQPLDSDDITAWVKERHTEKQFDITASTLAREWAQQWRRAKGKVSASQWGRLDDAARGVNEVQVLLRAIGDGSEDANGRKTITGHGRMRAKWTEGGNRSLVHAVRTSLKSQTDDRLALAAFRAACHRMAADYRRNKR